MRGMGSAWQTRIPKSASPLMLPLQLVVVVMVLGVNFPDNLGNEGGLTQYFL